MTVKAAFKVSILPRDSNIVAFVAESDPSLYPRGESVHINMISASTNQQQTYKFTLTSDIHCNSRK